MTHKNDNHECHSPTRTTFSVIIRYHRYTVEVIAFACGIIIIFPDMMYCIL